MDRFPVAESGHPYFARAWNASHHGTDIFAPSGTPLLAVEDGRARIMEGGKGGKTVYLDTDDGARHYYYAHLSSWERPTDFPRRVRAGEVLGYVGTTGNAQGRPPHLHFQIKLGTETVDPYDALATVAPPGAARSGGTALARLPSSSSSSSSSPSPGEVSAALGLLLLIGLMLNPPDRRR